VLTTFSDNNQAHGIRDGDDETANERLPTEREQSRLSRVSAYSDKTTTHRLFYRPSDRQRRITAAPRHNSGAKQPADDIVSASPLRTGT